MYKITVVKTLPLILMAATAAQAQTVCSNATLKGDYGVQIAGTRPAPSVLSGIQATPGTIEQVAGVVVQIFDGAGGFTQTDNVKGSLSGIALDRPGAGTYSVNPDCSGTFTVNNPGAPPIVNRFVIVDNGQAFTTVVVSPQAVMVTAIGKKMKYLAMCPQMRPRCYPPRRTRTAAVTSLPPGQSSSGARASPRQEAIRWCSSVLASPMSF